MASVDSTADSLKASAHVFNKILNQPRLSAKFRSQADVDEGVKKLRSLILVEGIPSSNVRCYLRCHLFRRTYI